MQPRDAWQVPEYDGVVATSLTFVMRDEMVLLCTSLLVWDISTRGGLWSPRQ